MDKFPTLKLFALSALLLATLFATGCATGPESPIAFSPDSLSSSVNRVGVLVEEIPATDTSFPGADCLLCIAAASAMHQGLTTSVRGLDHESLDGVGEKLVSSLRNRGIDARMVSPSEVNVGLKKFKGDSNVSPPLDYRVLNGPLAIDKLLIVRVHAQGVVRPMSSYVPNDIPKAHVKGVVSMVDLKSNNYDWYLPFDHRLAAIGNWKEPPNYPSLTNAYYKNLVRVSDGIVTAFLTKGK